MFQTNVSRVAPGWDLLKDALLSELLCRGLSTIVLLALSNPMYLKSVSTINFN